MLRITLWSEFDDGPEADRLLASEVWEVSDDGKAYCAQSAESDQFDGFTEPGATENDWTPLSVEQAIEALAAGRTVLIDLRSDGFCEVAKIERT